MADESRALAVLVLGMHRSGTSALSRVLNLRGLDIASRLIPASENNRTGFWESEELIALHDELLQQLGQRWQDLVPLPREWWESAVATVFRDRLLDYLERDFGHSTAFLIKDPRLCRLLPLWCPMLEQFGARACALLVLRNPLEVAASLEARRDFSVPFVHGLFLWLRYSLEAEYLSRGLPRCFISYEGLLDDWRGVLERVASRCELTWPGSEATTAQAVDEFLSNRQRHQHATVEDLRTHPDVPATVVRVYQALQALLEQPDDPAPYRVLDTARRRLDASGGWFAPLLAEQAQRQLRAEELHRQLEQQLRDSQVRFRQLEQTHRRELERLRAAHSERERQFRQQQQLQQERIRSLQGQAGELRQDVNRLQHQLAANKSEQHRLRQELQAVFESQSWHLTTPLRRCGDWLLSVRKGRAVDTSAFSVDRKAGEDLRLLADSGLFDRAYYLGSHQDVRDAGLDPLVHFMRTGAAEGRRPNPLFETTWYMRTYPDVVESGLNPLLHYLLHGADEGRNPGPCFDTLAYLEQHPELRKQGINPLAHCLANDDVDRYLQEQSDRRSDAGPAKLPATADRQRPAARFSDFSSYERNSIFLLKLNAPFTEEARRVIGYMNGMRRYLVQRHAQLPETALVSIVMPTFNRADCIGNAIRSVLAQSYRNFELLIVDDGGEDRTADVVEAFGDARLRYFRLERNRGAARARNHGLEQARGEFITYLDSDNTMEPDFLCILLGELLAADDADMVYCGQNIYLDRSGTGEDARLEGVRYATFSRSVLENRNYIDLGVLLHRHRVIEQHGGFNERMQRLIDWEFLLRLSESQCPQAVPCILSNYYHGVADNQITRLKSYDQALAHVDAYLAERKIIDQLPDHDLPGLEAMCSPRFQPLSVCRRKVAIIIPSYECLDYLALCIASIQRFTTVPHELIIVDNASSNPVRQFLQDLADQPDVAVIQNDHNYGFTYAVNQGLSRADPTSDVVLLNNDAVVTEGWIDAMQRVLDRLPETGLVVPRQVLPPDTPTIETHNPICHPTREADVNLSLHHDNIVDPGLDARHGYVELSFAPFFCVYIPRHTLDELGPLDHENAPHYRSDRLYCESVRRISGRRIVYTPHAKVYHFLQQATSALKQTDGERFDSLFVRNEWSALQQPEVVK